mgnify:CR=1 FL=1
MEIKLSRLKQIISEVVEERHASGRMDDIIQSTRGEEVDPRDQALDEMIAEEIEAAIEKFVVGEGEEEIDTAEEEGNMVGDVERVKKTLAAINNVTELSQLAGLILDLFAQPEIQKHLAAIGAKAGMGGAERQAFIKTVANHDA